MILVEVGGATKLYTEDNCRGVGAKVLEQK